MNKKERSLLLEEEDNMAENTIEFSILDNQLKIEIDNPWRGDDERGFGETTTIYLNAKQVAEIRQYLDFICLSVGLVKASTKSRESG